MTPSQFRALKKGDTVTLSEPRPVYACGFPTEDGRVYVPTGTAGTAGAVCVPAVTRNRVFACVDFPPDCPLVDHRGRPVTVPNPHRNEWRVSAYAEELA